MSGTVLVRRPGPLLADGLVTHITREPVDVALAVDQWHGYVDALRQAGWTIVEVPAADDCPDAVFIEDTVVMYDGVAVITRPGAVSRRTEIVDTEAVVAELGYVIERIVEPAALDGGDVLRVGTTVYVGRSGRTTAEGVDQVRVILEPHGATVVGVPISKVLHLKSAVTALPDGSIVGYPPLVDDPAVFPAFRPVPEESGSHVVVLDDGQLLMAASCPETAELYRSLGYAPIRVDISEFEKLEGCVTCLSVLLPPTPAVGRERGFPTL